MRDKGLDEEKCEVICDEQEYVINFAWSFFG
jgi:hypothetical protein